MKTPLIVAILILLLVIVVVGLFQLSSSQKTQEAERICTQNCVYGEQPLKSDLWEFRDPDAGRIAREFPRTFPERDQCVDYCLSLEE